VTGEISNESEPAPLDAEARGPSELGPSEPGLSEAETGPSEEAVFSVDENTVAPTETAEFLPTEEFAPAQVQAETVEAETTEAETGGEAPFEPVAEAAPPAHAERHEIASDPEGFAIVEENGADEPQTAQGAADASAQGSETEAPAFAQREGDARDHDDSQDLSADDGAEDDEARASDFLNREQENDRAAPDHDEENAENESGEQDEEEIVEQLGGDAMDETPYRAPRMRRQYKIQEVIKRRQVLLIQVVKEERGNKGAALTTYLSLAGRYSVLMPNTARGGGISRKITEANDRKRLKEIAQDLEVPEGMGVILRTAGASRTKQEIQRDFEYLMRMWEQVRALTLSSSAPALVYEEGSLIKRAIRDLYSKEIDEVVVAGDAGYREARDFMRLLMPSHVKNVQCYRDPQPVFAKWGAEAQLDALFHNQVTLKSGGYLVINQTEALVAIDVNSGRSTREHNIEDTALRTNLEAADEVARQLRLRDLAGLIVVDFIDMEEGRNNRAVERRIKEALKDDRARIQVGRISHFGLLEMSRQRIRTGVLEGSSVVCPHCAGVGTVRSTASVAVHVMRVLEDALIKSASHDIILRTRTDIALYILNQKRSLLRLIEERFGVSVVVMADDSLTGGAYHALERGELAAGPSDPLRRFDPRRPIEDIEPIGEAELEVEFEEEAEIEASDGAEGETAEERADSESRRRRRRRRGRGRNFERDGAGVDASAPQPSDEGLETVAEISGDLMAPVGEDESEEEGAREGSEGRRRGRGNWRRRNRSRSGSETLDNAGDWRPSEEAGAETVEGGDALIETLSENEQFAPLPVWSPGSEIGATAPEAGTEKLEIGEIGEIPPAPEFVRASPVQDASVQDASVQESPVHLANDHEVKAEAAAEPAAIETAPAEPAPVEALSPAPSAPEPAPAPNHPELQPELPVITEADPNQPKRSGWWARAKANLTGH
jgi:ribonuclease E